METESTFGRPKRPKSLPSYFKFATGGVEGGVTWAVCHAPRYGFNGYARIPDGHPWHSLDYDQIQELDEDLSVHGGLTFASDGWIGFDTHHAYDYWPGDSTSWRLAGEEGIHWTQEMVENEARSLATQVAEAGR